jgi:hypothetical protein
VARLLAMPQQEVIDGFKGSVDFYEWKGIPVARRWPRSPGHNRVAAVQAQWAAFSEAQSAWSTLDPDVIAAYNAMAVGTDYTGRDMMTVGYIAGFQYV